MNIYVMTLFPEMLDAALSLSIIGRARKSGAVGLNFVNIRDFSGNKHNNVDDYPYGGGAGMVMRAQPIYDAYRHITAQLPYPAASARVLFMSPQGRRFDQRMARELSREASLIILCGHYEGVDERVVEEIVTDEVSLGDFVLTGGEIAAMAVIDAVVRLKDGVLGSDRSALDESFSSCLLEYPQYTRPEEFMGRRVPDVLLSGHHANIEKWRRERAMERTRRKRPDLLQMSEH